MHRKTRKSRAAPRGRRAAAQRAEVPTYFQYPSNFPRVVTLCGSTRFKEAFTSAQLKETLAGKIVLTIGCNMKSDTELFGRLAADQLVKIKAGLDALHKQKIRMSDEILVLNVCGYIGDSTRGEIKYALAHGKTVVWQFPDLVPMEFGGNMPNVNVVPPEWHNHSSSVGESFEQSGWCQDRQCPDRREPVG